jgi:hypothetical protein
MWDLYVSKVPNHKFPIFCFKGYLKFFFLHNKAS